MSQQEPSSAEKALNKVARKSRITKNELAFLLAQWAELNPSNKEQRANLEAMWQNPDNNEHNLMSPSEAGATLLDSSQMIISVAGSGHTHAAAFLCTMFPVQAKGGSICLTKRPCSFCLKIMGQVGLSRVLVLSSESTIIEQEPHRDPAKAKLSDSQFNQLLTSAGLAYSLIGYDRSEEGVRAVQQWKDLMIEFRALEDRQRDIKELLLAWHSGLAIISAMRSDDLDLRVGAVLAEVYADGKESIIHSVGYNGFYRKTHDLDFDVKYKAAFSLHAEQNLLLFRGSFDLSRCVLFVTHSPCHQCTCLLKANRIVDSNIYYVKLYNNKNWTPAAHLVTFGAGILTEVEKSMKKLAEEKEARDLAERVGTTPQNLDGKFAAQGTSESK